MTLGEVTLSTMQVLEVFPQTRAETVYFAELGDKLPQKLKSVVNFFMLQELPEQEEDHMTVPEAPTPPPQPTPSEDESPKTRRRKRKADSDDVPETPKEEEPVVKKPIRKRQESTEPVYKLYLKATQDGVLGKKGDLVLAQKIPAGTQIHLAKRKKYVQTMIYYENTWYKL